MADLSHVTEYAALTRHRREMEQARQQRRRRLALTLSLVVAISAGGYLVSPPLGLMLTGIGAMVLFFAAVTGGSSVPHHVMAGVEGEARVLERLGELPDNHVVFNQVQVPDPQLPNGRRELDFVVVGPAAVTIIEVKNTPGLIQVEPDRRQWRVVTRAGCGSRPGWNAIDNPLPQVRSQVDTLERWALRHGQVLRPKAMVCFARSDASIAEPELADIPVVTTRELLEHVAATQSGPAFSDHDRQAALSLLKQTTAPQVPAAA
ncbi:NERD domain-containing protein [Wenzhouxiangella sp. AB-CW3]|uniref:nuclease-related domain-containing protein n=1 Tax=Wenzhouxiangella sp. AB-CW3 TaxID=2771012 RepID=UPI00168AAF09|nr:nuclease-related domain-containing protein [Wenzhouxiangella sp. AB-CW3]QOC22150.1 NERD domain-containing protein [Wenzhouxiangella sp. AB-CW3]